MTEEKKKILVVDDEQDLRTVIFDILTDAGYAVELAENGRQGLTVAKALQPDLILCDIQMPAMNGYELLDAVKSEPNLGKTPFVFMTGVNVGQFHLRRGMDLGADDYLTKPFSTDDLVNAIRSRLKKKQSWQAFYDAKIQNIHSGIVLLLPNELHLLVMDILEHSHVLLKESSLTPETIHTAARNIQSSAKRLGRLHENILLFSMLQYWTKDTSMIDAMKQERTDSFLSILSSVLDENPRASERRQTISVACADAAVQISPAYFGKVLDEVIDNACKYSPPEKAISVSSETDAGQVKITIRDTGRGMSAEQIRNSSSFMEFGRGFYEQQGSGLGLAIAKALTELHGGTFSIHSTAGSGTAITASFPVVPGT